MGAQAIRPCCGHPDGWHIDMCDGTEKCAGCDCCTPTGTVDNTPEHDLTPSEVALARVLAAWEAWPNEGEGDAWQMMGEIHLALFEDGWISGDVVTDSGASLLARAQKAGVL